MGEDLSSVICTFQRQVVLQLAFVWCTCAIQNVIEMPARKQGQLRITVVLTSSHIKISARFICIQSKNTTRPFKQCKSFIDVLMLRQYLEKEFFCGEEEKRRRTRLTYNCAHLRSTKESLILEYDTGSLEGGTGWYLVVLGQ